VRGRADRLAPSRKCCWDPTSRADDVDDAATAAGAELDVARREGEQGVVTATADVVAGVEVRAVLADDDL
jgi:hypothetical protein